MKQLITIKPKEIVLQDVETPKIEKENEVLVKIKAAGICGSDVHIYHGTSPVATYPRVMGHEMVGVVEKIGSSVTKVKEGDRVIVEQIIYCGTCPACKAGRHNVCCHLKVRGVHVDGGFREYITVPQDDLHILPDDLPFEEAVLIEPMSIAFQATDRACVTENDVVFVLGGGALGKSIIKALKIRKAQIIVADVEENRLTEALELGANHVINVNDENFLEKVKSFNDGYGPTVSIDAAGIKTSLDTLTEVTCNAGRVITMAFSEEFSNVKQFKITAKELDIRGSRLQKYKFPEVIKAYGENKNLFKDQISHIIEFKDVYKAFDLIESKDKSVKKIVLTF